MQVQRASVDAHAVGATIRDVLRHPSVSLGITCYIALTIMAFQYPTFGMAPAPNVRVLGYSLPGLANALSFVGIGILWGWRQRRLPARVGRYAAGIFVTVGIVGHHVVGLIAADGSAWWLALVCDVLIGGGVALLSIGWIDRLAAMSTLVASVTMVVAAFGTAALLLVAHGASALDLTALMGLGLLCISVATQRDTSIVRLSRSTRPHIPWKLMVAIFLQGLSVGLVHSSLVVGPQGLLPTEALGLVIAGALAAGGILWLRMDFNHLMFMLGLPLLALGQLWAVLVYPLELGTVLHESGYRLVMIISWIIAAWTVRTKGVTSCWVWPCIMVSFTLGRFAGPLLEAIPAPMFVIDPLVALPVAVAFVVLFAAFVLFDSASPQTGWGVVRASESSDMPAPSNYDQACTMIAAEYGLSPREREMLGYLAKGRNVEYISDTLSLSKETVRTHRRNLYRKIDIHAQQDLMSLLEQVELQLCEQAATTTLTIAD